MSTETACCHCQAELRPHDLPSGVCTECWEGIVQPAYGYVESVTPDDPVRMMWHGYAVREAFIAGAVHEKKAGECLTGPERTPPPLHDQAIKRWCEAERRLACLRAMIKLGWKVGHGLTMDGMAALLGKLLDQVNRWDREDDERVPNTRPAVAIPSDGGRGL